MEFKKAPPANCQCWTGILCNNYDDGCLHGQRHVGASATQVGLTYQTLLPYALKTIHKHACHMTHPTPVLMSHICHRTTPTFRFFHELQRICHDASLCSPLSTLMDLYHNPPPLCFSPSLSLKPVKADGCPSPAGICSEVSAFEMAGFPRRCHQVLL